MSSPVFVPASSGATIRVMTSTVRHILTASQTAGSLSLFEITDEAGSGVPPHVHEREDETFHILDGTYEFFINGAWKAVGPGTTVFGPRGKAHGFRAVTKGRMLVTVTPCGIEGMFADLAALPMPPQPARIMEVCARYQISFV